MKTKIGMLVVTIIVTIAAILGYWKLPEGTFFFWVSRIMIVPGFFLILWSLIISSIRINGNI